MKNLGKKIVIIFAFLSTTIYANVIAEVSPKVVYRGDEATYSLTVDGSKIEKPIISTLCGTNVTGTRSQTSIQMINMDYKKSYTLSYTFVPQKSCVIAPVSLRVDGKIVKSNAVNVVVKKPTQSKNANFVLSLKASKSNLYVGEPFTLELTFRQSKNAQAVDSKFVAPKFKGFWVKGTPKTTRSETDEYVITKARYKLAPQREGNLTINPAAIKIASRVNSNDSWGMIIPQVKWRTYYSNEVHIHAKALPNNAKLVGNFTIKATADKTTINPSEAVNVTVEVDGNGDLEDIGSFKPYINGVNVFGEKIEIRGNKLTQKLAFVSDKDFTIPPFSLSFYNLKTKKVEKIETKAIRIKVNGSTNKTEKLQIEKAQPSKIAVQTTSQTNAGNTKIDVFWMLVVFLLGTAFGIALMVWQPLRFIKKVKSFNVKDEKLLLMKLLPFKDKDAEVQKIADILEANIYSSKKEQIDKKLLKEILKKYEII